MYPDIAVNINTETIELLELASAINVARRSRANSVWVLGQAFTSSKEPQVTAREAECWYFEARSIVMKEHNQV